MPRRCSWQGDGEGAWARSQDENGNAVAGGDAAVRPAVNDLPDELRPLYNRRPLPEAQQHALLVRMNYLKFRARELRGQLDRRQPGAGEIDRIESLLAQVAAVRVRLTQGSLPVVLAAGRRHLIGREDPGGYRLLHLLEVGNGVLIEAIDGFDIARGGTFEAFLSWSLMRRFASEEGLSVPGVGTAGAVGGAERGGGALKRAQRRDHPKDVLDRMIDAAGESGVDLKLDDQ